MINELSKKFEGKARIDSFRENVFGNNLSEIVHWFSIKVIGDNRQIVEFLSWSGLKWELRLKYDWYFKYRAALLQVKYPKFEIQTHWGNQPATGKTLEEIRQAKIRAKKSKITEYKNKLEKAELNWSSLFPIQEHIDYQRAVEKIRNLEIELENL